MRKGRLTKALAVGIVCSMAFLSACGKKSGVITEGGDRPAKEIDKDHVYSFENVDIPVEGNCNVNRVCANKDCLYASVYNYDNFDGAIKLFKMPYETGEMEEISLGDQKNASFDSFTCDDEGNIYTIKYVFSDDDSEDVSILEDGEDAEGKKVVADSSDNEATAEASDNEEATDTSDNEAESDSADDESSTVDAMDSDSQTLLVKISDNGEVIWEKPLTEEDASSYVRTMIYAKDLGILTSSEAGLCVYDAKTGEGKVFSKREHNEDDYYSSYLFRLRNDDIYLIEEGGDNPVINKLNAAKDAFEKVDVTLPEGIYGGYSLYAGNSYDFYEYEDNDIYAFNLGDEKATKICDFTASNEIISMLSFIGESPDGKLVIANSSDEDTAISFLTKVDPQAVEEKEIITLGTVYVSDDVRKQVVKFNKTNDKYKIDIMDYADIAGEEGTDDDGDTYMTGINKLSLDITQGKAPDIIVVESDMPFESYAAKGAIEPLEPYFDTDQDINVQDYLQNVLDATKVQGHIYSIIPSFSVTTCVVAKDNAKGEVVTLDNYKDICKQAGIDPEVGMGVLTRSDARSLYSTIGSTYVNYEDGTCSFDSESFVKFLEFIKELPDDDEDYDYEKYEAYYRENKSLLKTYWLSSFEDYQVLKKGYFGKDIEFNGYPTTKDGKSYINARAQISMSSDCKNKQAVWEFMKSFLTDDYQKKLEWCFPVKKTAVEALAKKAQEKNYYIDSDGKKVENTSVWSIGGTEVEIGELSKEETQTVVDFIESVTETQSSDDNVINIIAEEAAAFYEGQKSAEEVADIIQSRVSIYLSEQM